MPRGRSCAPWAACLALLPILIGSGCAGPAHRSGGVAGGGGFLPRLTHPADPIARLGPAPVSIGPFADPGTYTPAGPRVAQPAPNVGPLTVGGGQLADRGSSAIGPRSARQRPAEGPSLAEVGGRANGSPRSPEGRSPSDFQEGGERPIVLDLARAAGGEADADSSTVGPGRIVLADRASSSALEREAGAEMGLPPMLARGIDLETYAAPPISNDPDARLASGRRPISVLGSGRSGPVADPSPSEPEPEPGSEPSYRPDLGAEAPADDPILEPIEDAAPARDDVLPAAIRPGPSLAADRPSAVTDPHASIGSPSPFEPSPPRTRLLSRVRHLGHRLGAGMGAALDRGRGEAGPADAPTPRRPLLRGREDVGWLFPGG